MVRDYETYLLRDSSSGLPSVELLGALLMTLASFSNRLLRLSPERLLRPSSPVQLSNIPVALSATCHPALEFISVPTSGAINRKKEGEVF